MGSTLLLNSYLTMMNDNNQVHFVFFESGLDKDLFLKRWEEYDRSDKNNKGVTLQEAQNGELNHYISQHRVGRNDGEFVFRKSANKTRVFREPIKSQLGGGYEMTQIERTTHASAGERKVFVFLKDNTTDLTPYHRLAVEFEMNIYEAYFESCRYARVLEYFVKQKQVATLLDSLPNDGEHHLVFKELVLAQGAPPKAEEDRYVWS